MLDRIHSPAVSRIGAVVAEVLSKHGITGPLAMDDEFARYGMTSIDMVELMLGIEAEFDIGIPAAEITLKNFHSTSAVAAMVARLTSTS